MDQQLEWCRANIRGFKDMHDAVLAVRAEEAENRRVMQPAVEADMKRRSLGTPITFGPGTMGWVNAGMIGTYV